MNALGKAMVDADRSYMAAKASVADATSQLLARGPSGLPLQQTDLSRASEQLKHFSGWVYAAVRPIAQRIAGQPIHVGRVKVARRPEIRLPSGFVVKGDAAVEPLDSHPILDLLADPNDLMVAWSLIYTTVASLELTGRQLWWLPGKNQILPIPTSWIVGYEGSTAYTAFKVRPPSTGEPFSIPSDECCYFAYPNPADPHGATSPLQAVGGAVDADEAMTTSQQSMFARGIHPSHAILLGKVPVDGVPGGLRPRLTPAQERQLIGAVKKRYEGVSRHGEPIILDGVIEDVKRLSNTVAEMDYLQSGKATKSRIMQGFGVNPIVAGEIEGANRASSTVAEKHFIDTCVNPKIELISQVLTEWLSPMFGGGLKVWIEPCQVEDAEMKLKWATMLLQAQAVTANGRWSDFWDWRHARRVLKRAA